MTEPASIAQAAGGRVCIKAPDKPGIHRLHIRGKDGKGHAATANMRLEVH
ncbi:MAG: hypothetical protein MUF86_01695 [Akkermansiaceae bacterium]|nr:hypothetical protein [Akkermansiaceae bacterium]MCU0776364.1 hypothetical protein [Akkermansiaceae bacterium]